MNAPSRDRSLLSTSFRRDQRGVTMVEFGLIAAPLIMMIVGVTELGLVGTAQHILDNATFSASRGGKTGYAETASTQEKYISDTVKKAASSFLDPAKITLTSVAYDDFGDIGQPEPFTDKNSNGKWDSGEAFTDKNSNGSWDKDQGKSGYGKSAQIVVYTAQYNWILVTPYMKYLVGTDGVVKVKSRIVVKNEPF